MQIHQDYDHSRYAIRSYESGRLTVIAPWEGPPPDRELLERMQAQQSRVVEEPVVVTGKRLITGWAPESVEALRAGHLEPLLALDMEVLILGTGARQIFPHPRHLQPLMARGVGVEVMDTAAACRTYNFLVSDGREVAAALFL